MVVVVVLVSENVHLYEVGVFVLVLVNVIVTPCFTVLGEYVKDATGLTAAVTVTVLVRVELPAVLLVVNLILIDPALVNL